MDIDAETRADLTQLVSLSRVPRTMAAVISGVSMRYLDMLKRQLEVEAAGDRLMLYRVKADGAAEPLSELNLRL
jgi:hypothetical protein